MTVTAESLNPLRLPLYGERLIEASAGTGKTFTIAALYLRLLLGLGGGFVIPLLYRLGKPWLHAGFWLGERSGRTAGKNFT